MSTRFSNIITKNELKVLSEIVLVGETAYKEFMQDQSALFNSPYLSGEKGRIHTKFIQLQSEIASRNSDFPFEFVRRKFDYGQYVPEIRNSKVIIHIARSDAPNVLPYPSKYKIELSNNNNPLQRQLKMTFDDDIRYTYEPYYGILTFGENFASILFPEPGYNGVSEQIELPRAFSSETERYSGVFERKKAVLKEEYLLRNKESNAS